MDISESKRCYNVIPSVHYFYIMTNTLADFQICISVPLIPIWHIFLVRSFFLITLKMFPISTLLKLKFMSATFPCGSFPLKSLFMRKLLFLNSVLNFFFPVILSFCQAHIMENGVFLFLFLDAAPSAPLSS